MFAHFHVYAPDTFKERKIGGHAKHIVSVGHPFTQMSGPASLILSFREKQDSLMVHLI
jgi:hypothetical protein